MNLLVFDIRKGGSKSIKMIRIASCYLKRITVVILLAAFVYCVVQVLKSELNFNDNDLSNSDKL